MTNKGFYVTGEIPKYNDVQCVQYLGRDSKRRQIWAHKCPYCSNFFSARLDSVKSGNTKSCGCKGFFKKQNRFIIPNGYDHGIAFYDNYDGYFIFDMEDLPLIRKHHWSAKKNGNRIEPYTIVNRKKIKLSRLLMNTPEDLEVDHINHEPNDARKKNMRNCTQEENLKNRKCSKYYNPDDPFSYEQSQKIAQQNEVYQFPNKQRLYFGEIIDEIQSLPVVNIYNYILNRIRQDKQNNRITDEQEILKLQRLIKEYKEWKAEQSA